MIFNNTLKSLAVVSLLSTIAHTAYCFPAWEINMQADVNYARIQGMAQTPRGGMPNTTDTSRPTLREAGIIDEWYYDVGAGISLYHFFLNFVYRHLEPQGNDILKLGLRTHNQYIAQGQNIHLRMNYDWYQLQMGNYFKIFKPGFAIAPLIEGHWIHYGYTFSSPPFASARSFSMAASNLGLGFRFPVISSILGEIQATTTLPFSNLAINRVNLALHTCMPFNKHVEFRPQLNLSVFRIHYEDYQLIANDIRYTANPNIALGGTLAFH